jgi:hypothetical protein
MLVIGLRNKSRCIVIDLELHLIFKILIELGKYVEY